MNREFYTRKAYLDAVKAAKVCGKPLSIWPGKKHLVKLEDLPVITEGHDAENFLDTLMIRTDAELQTLVETGRRYARFSTLPTKLGEFAVGEWK